MQKLWVGDLPGQNTQQLYDLEPLLPQVEAGYTLLTPNYRLARRIKAAWDQLQLDSGAVAWAPLSVYPMESWLLQRWQDAVRWGLTADCVTLAEGPALELWQQAIEEEQRAAGQYSLLQTGAAASLANQARNTLLRWQVDVTQARFRSLFELDEDCASWLRWLERFEQRLRGEQWATPGDCIAALLQCATEMPPAKVVLLDFDDIPPLFNACIAALCEQLETHQPQGPAAPSRAIGFVDKRAELHAVAAWARHTSQQQPAARIGIVLADMANDRTILEYLLRQEFACLGDNYTSLPVNFSTGITLDKASVVRDAMAILRLCLQQLELKLLPGLLQSRFVLMPDAGSPAAIKMLRQLYDSGRTSLDVADLRHLANRVKMGEGEPQGLLLGKYLLEVAGLRELRQPALPSVWLDRLCKVLDIWGWPGPGPLDSLEYQQLEQWYSALESLASYDDVCGALALDGVLALLQRILAKLVFQPQTADSNVQVLGTLEAAGLAFDYLWLCSMQASQWPAAARPNPFIPVNLQRELHMPHATAEREWLFADGLMQQYQHSAGELHASFARQQDTVPELPSALLADFALQHDDQTAPLNPDWLSQWRAIKLEQLDNSFSVALGATELGHVGGGSGLLEDQSQCPFRAFARRRLRAEPLGEPVTGVSAAQRGSVLHDALYALFALIPDSETLALLDEEAEQQQVLSAVTTALEDLPSTGLLATTASWRELEGLRLQKLLRQWLAVERQRSAFAVAAREEDLGLQLQGLELRLRVDRIDRLPDGSALIIDYKSGVCRLQDWLGERPAKPQLLLYGIAAQDPPSALSFAQLREGDCAFIGAGETGKELARGIKTDIATLVRGGWEVDSWTALNERWRGQLQLLADEFLAGEARVDPQPNACTWCGLQSLCRIDRVQVLNT